MGAGRSGSTIAGILLGNMDKYFFSGELHLWNMTKGETFNERSEVIDFWKKVSDAFPDKEEYFKYDFDKKLEFHTAMPAFIGLGNKKIIEEFHKQSQKLFTIVKNQSGKEVVIDSSHYALRAYWLSKNKHLDVSYIYIYRNPVDVIKSFSKKNIEHTYKNFFAANLYLLSVTMLVTIVYALLPKNKKVKIRYEEIINCPEKVLHRVEKITAVPSSQVDINKLDTGYIFRSNRIRHQQQISLKRETKINRAKKFSDIIINVLHSPFLVMHRKKC